VEPPDGHAGSETRKDKRALGLLLAHQRDIAGVRIRCQWLAVSVISIVKDNEKAQVHHRRIHGMPVSDDDNRVTGEAPKKLGVSLRPDFVAIPQNNSVVRDDLPQGLMMGLQVAPVRNNDDAGSPRRESPCRKLCDNGCPPRSGLSSRAVVNPPRCGECPPGPWRYEPFEFVLGVLEKTVDLYRRHRGGLATITPKFFCPHVSRWNGKPQDVGRVTGLPVGNNAGQPPNLRRQHRHSGDNITQWHKRPSVARVRCDLDNKAGGVLLTGSKRDLDANPRCDHHPLRNAVVEKAVELRESAF
jgi:hypothetical protein